MRILAIGNSFSQDATRYVYQVARAQGISFELVNLFIPSCSIEMHYRNMLGNKKDYGLEYNGHITGFNISLEDALLNREWDVITIQQLSTLSYRKVTYYPYIIKLIDYIKKYQPKAKLLLHQTWAYEDGSDRLIQWTGYNTAKAMLAEIQKTYAEVAKSEGFDGIIPSGTLIDMMLDRGVEKIHRDASHITRGLGRYALGLLWFRMLTGKSVADNKFCDLDIPASEEEMAIAKECVDSFEPIFK